MSPSSAANALFARFDLAALAPGLGHQVDYILFATLALVALLLVCTRVRRVPGRRLPIGSLIVFGSTLLAGWPFVEIMGTRPQQNVIRILANVTPNAALLLEKAGHERFAAGLPADGEQRRALDALLERFLAGAPNIVGISTLRRAADGKISYLLRAVKARPGDPSPPAAFAAAGQPGDVVSNPSPVLHAVLRSGGSHSADTLDVREDRWVMAVARLHRSDGSIDGAVVVDFDVGLWAKARRMYRAGTMAMIALILAVVLVSGYSTASLRSRLHAMETAEARSRESESRLRQIMDASADALVLVDEQARITSWNRQAKEMFAWEDPGPDGRPVGQVIAPEATSVAFAEGLNRLLQSRHDGPVRERLEMRRTRANGLPLVAELTLSDLTLGGRRHFVIFIREITDRSRAEENIRELTSRLERAQHFALRGTWELEFETGHVTANPQALSLLGFEQNSRTLSPGQMSERLHPDDVEHYREALQLAAREGSDFSSQFRIILHDGSLRYIQMRGQPWRDQIGRIRGLTGTLLDTTELAAAHAAARVGQRQFESIFESAVSALLVTDGDRRVTLANVRMEQVLQRPRAELIGLPVEEVVRGSGLLPSDAPRISECIDGKSVRLRRRLPDETVFHGELYVRSIDTLSGRGLFVQIDDTTARESRQQADLRAHRLESLGSLSAGIAHDLNNALAPISMGVSLLHRRFPEAHSLLELIDKSTARTANLVKQLLTFARGRSGDRRTIESRTVIEEMAGIVTSTFPKNIGLRLDNRTASTVVGDATQLHQVLLNLCVNARDAMPDGGTLTIGSGDCELTEEILTGPGRIPPGRYVKWWVSDEGTGIPPEILDRIFDPFFTTKELGKGTGLGLATVLGIVRGHDGFLNVISRPGAGTTFEVFLPVARKDQSSSAGGILAPAAVFRGNGELVLVVDDEESVREVIRTLLVELDFRVIVAANGAEGLRLLEQSRQDIVAVITDLQMPGMGGIQFMAAAKAFVPLSRIVITSGFMEESEAQALVSTGLAAVLRKPFSQLQLIGALSTALRRHPITPNHVAPA